MTIQDLSRGLIPVLCTCFLVSLPSECASHQDFYVSTQGKDTHPGTKDKPFRTFERAREEIRTHKKHHKDSGSFTVWIRGGAYHRTGTFILSQKDSGTEKAPVKYRAFEHEKVHLIGGKEITRTSWITVSDREVLSRADRSVQGKLLSVNLKEKGITDFGEMSLLGPMFELFFRGKRLPVARWPNSGYAEIGRVLEQGEKSTPQYGDGNRQGRTFQYSGNRPERWKNSKDIRLHGFWWYGWMDQQMKIKKIDTEKKEITLDGVPGGGIRRNQWFCALNLLEEIDQPGEWYLDRSTGILYLFPPEGFPHGSMFFSTLKEPHLVQDESSHVVIQ